MGFARSGKHSVVVQGCHATYNNDAWQLHWEGGMVACAPVAILDQGHKLPSHLLGGALRAQWHDT